MTHRDTREKYRATMTRLAATAYAHHEIRESSEGRWLLQKRRPAGGWEGNMWTEIITLRHKGLLVDGDIDPVVFRYGPAHPEARVRWMGCRMAAHDPYFKEKASIGMGGRIDGLVEQWDPEVAADDLRAMEAEFKGETEDEPNPKLADAVAHARMHRLEYGRDSVLWSLYEAGIDSESLSSVGMVTTPRLYWAHGALAKLAELLDAKESAD